MRREPEAKGVSNELGEVAPCNCGGVNLTVGAVTIHFERDEVAELAQLVTGAVELVNRSNVTGRPKTHGPLH